MCGLFNGVVTHVSGISAFIITLATNFVVIGATMGFSRLIANVTSSSIVQSESARAVFASKWGQANISILWWIGFALACGWILGKTTFGNWIYATGDNREAARANGVPVDGVRIALFMGTALCATIFAACQVFETNSADAAKGNLKELEAIAIAVVGGTLMTGGFGSVVGVAMGAVTFGLVANAVFFIPQIDGSYYRVFVGLVLLTAVFLNDNLRKRITGGL